MEQELIVPNPRVLMGKPMVPSTRITVELILEKLDAGEAVEQLIETHPRPSPEAILAALTFESEGGI
jgi:uncharacterized protein (DUF433 family)